MACTLAESPCDPLHRKLRQLRCLRRRFDCYRVERTSSRAGVAPAEVQRLFTAHCYNSYQFVRFPTAQSGGCYIVAIALLSMRLSYEDNRANVPEKRGCGVGRTPIGTYEPTAYCLGCRLLLLIHFFFGAVFISEVRPPIMVRASSAWKGKCRTDCCPLPFREISTRRLLAQMMVCIRFEILSFSS